MNHDQLITSQLNFIRKILSVFSHEINNHLAYIKESVGLVGDFIELKKTAPKDLQEMLNIIQSIKNQIEKTAYFCDKLNGFGYGIGEPLSSLSVHKSLEELIVLLYRLAHQKRISLEKDFTRNIPLIRSCPLQLQFLVFCLIENYLERLDKNSRIIVKTAYSDNSIGISIIPKGNFIETDGEGICNEEIYDQIITRLGGNICRKSSDEGITIMLPVSPPAGSRQEAG